MISSPPSTESVRLLRAYFNSSASSNFGNTKSIRAAPPAYDGVYVSERTSSKEKSQQRFQQVLCVVFVVDREGGSARMTMR